MRTLGGWLVFIAASLLTVILARPNGPPRTGISATDFQRVLQEGRVEYVTIEGNRLYGKLSQEHFVAAGKEPVLHFNVELHRNMADRFIQWVKDNLNGARIQPPPDGNVFADIILPLLPWLLIFGFIFFSALRQIRAQARHSLQLAAQQPPGGGNA